MEKLARDKHSGLLRKFVTYGRKMFYNIGPRIYWPSFNGAMVQGPARQRATLNTYISLTGSTVTALLLSLILGR
jgi:hypothetical protein